MLDQNTLLHFKFDEDMRRVFEANKWSLRHGYVSRNSGVAGKSLRIYFHRAVMGVTDGKVIVDHINRDKLDNRRSNLRFVTRKENTLNKCKQSNNTCGYKGVSKNGKGFRTSICRDGVKKNIGYYYKTPVLAAIAYDDAARVIHGEYAFQNFETIKQRKKALQKWTQKA